MTQKFSDDDQSVDEKTAVVKGDTFKVRMEQAARTPPVLVMLEGPAGYVGKQWPLDKNDIVIGRSMTSNIFIDDRSVSKSHAKINVANGDVYILDLESTNRTVVNSDTVPPLVPVKLSNNDQIKTGNVLFKFLEGGSIEAHAMEHLQTKSEKDTLTGAYNKGALNMRGAESFKRSKLLKVPMAIAIFDIDHFKKVNDTYGHPAGDFVLKELAGVIGMKLIRLDDFFARYGGEEFVVVLFGSSIEQGAEIGERFRATIEGHRFSYNGTVLPITISVGVAAVEPEMTTWEELFSKADTALYASKRGGRNRVTTT